MENILLIIHLILAILLIAVVLLQRTEGGALGIGGGGGGVNAGRPPTTPLAKATWGLAIAFIATSLTLTIIAAQDSGSRSVIDRLGVQEDAAPAQEEGSGPNLDELLTPPPAADDAPAPSGGGGRSGGGSAPLSPPSAD